MNSIQKLGSNLNNPFIALRHRNFQIYSVGICVSLIGTWMQNIAQPWLAYQLTNSPLLLSLIGALQFTPVLLFSLFAGVIIDKFPKKRLLVLTQSGSLVITLVLAILVLTGKVQYWHILVMSILLGLINTLDMPTRQTFVIELVGKEDLMNAIALNSTFFNVSRVIGPALAGLVMAYAGISACFFINSFSFAAVLISLIFIKPLPVQRLARASLGIMAEIRDGLRYIKKNVVLFESLLFIAILATFAPNFNVLVPVFAKNILHEGETGFGFLMSFLGVGSFIGAMLIATLSRSGPRKIIMYFTPLIVAAFLILTGLAGNFAFTAIYLAVTGLFFIAFASNANSMLQLNTSDEYRGRVMSMYSLIFAGSTPIGNLFAGVITDRINARAGFVACGTVVIILMIPLLIYIGIKGKRQKDKRLTGYSDGPGQVPQ